MFKKADVCLFFKTEKIQERSIQYYTGVETDMGILLKFPKRQILYLSSLEETPKVDFVVKNFDFKQVVKDLKRTKAKTIGLYYSELTKKSFDFETIALFDLKTVFEYLFNISGISKIDCRI